MHTGRYSLTVSVHVVYFTDLLPSGREAPLHPVFCHRLWVSILGKKSIHSRGKKKKKKRGQIWGRKSCFLAFFVLFSHFFHIVTGHTTRLRHTLPWEKGEN